MVRQATVRDGSTSLNGVIDGIGDLGTNIVNLATLQAQLAAYDLKDMTGRIIPAMVSVAVLVPLAFSGFIALSLSLAYWMSTALGVSPPAALALVGVTGLMLAAGLSFYAWRRFSASLTAFRRSREELDRNIAWLGTVLKQSGR
jgi:hypothetical protein